MHQNYRFFTQNGQKLSIIFVQSHKIRENVLLKMLIFFSNQLIYFRFCCTRRIFKTLIILKA